MDFFQDLNSSFEIRVHCDPKFVFGYLCPFLIFFWPFKIRFLLTFRCFHWIFVCFFINIFGYFCIIEYAVEMINYWTIFHLSHFFGKSRSLKFDQLSKDGEKLCKFFKYLIFNTFILNVFGIWYLLVQWTVCLRYVSKHKASCQCSTFMRKHDYS